MATPNEIQRKIMLKRQQLSMEKDSVKRSKMQNQIKVLELQKQLAALKKN